MEIPGLKTAVEVSTAVVLVIIWRRFMLFFPPKRRKRLLRQNANLRGAAGLVKLISLRTAKLFGAG